MPNVFESFQKSLERLKEILRAEPTIANRDSTIKRFEFTYELAWKSLQKYLREKDVLALTPRDCFMEAFRIGLIQDDVGWIQMGQDRNLTAHTYNETLAEQVYKRISGYISLFDVLESAINPVRN
jgi:nucleotidyltransferase substrate binding protein (TIGR01987 family)